METALEQLANSPPYGLVLMAAKQLGAVQSDIPGLWNAPGYPELTTAQLLGIASSRPSVLSNPFVAQTVFR